MLSLVHLYFHHFLIDNHAPNYLTAEVKISFCILLPFLKNNDSIPVRNTESILRNVNFCC